jgi:hypothetical protein
MTKHTPMEWAYDEDDARIYYDDGNLQPTIAYVERDGVAPEQVKAEGYLLAGAPGLLALAHAVLGFDIATPKDYATKGPEAFSPLHRHIIDIQNKARAAIAKAAGDAV